jgi:hypothetical protein
MGKFKNEVKTIQVMLKGSRWARDPETIVVLDEYQRIIDADTVKSPEKRVALQIMFSSRAIDTFLAHICKWDCAQRREAPPPYYTLETSLGHLNGRGLHNGTHLSQSTYNDLCKNVKDKRNRYLHQAGAFPSNLELGRFLSSTVNGMREVSKL